METATFAFPSMFWCIPPGLAVAGIAYLLLKKWDVSLFLGMALITLGWMFYGTALDYALENWLASQRVYAVLFADFPPDKDHFIAEFRQAYKEGPEAFTQKQEEMKIIMMEHHVKHYIAQTPSSIVSQYINAETWLLSDLFNKNPSLCQQYLSNSAIFADVWRISGSEIFLKSIYFTPFMITESVDHPEKVTQTDRLKAERLYAQLYRSLQAQGVNLKPTNGALSCDAAYREYYALSQLPPKDGALIVKYLYSEDHLKNADSGTGMGGFILNFISNLNPLR